MRAYYINNNVEKVDGIVTGSSCESAVYSIKFSKECTCPFIKLFFYYVVFLLFFTAYIQKEKWKYLQKHYSTGVDRPKKDTKDMKDAQVCLKSRM